MDRPICKMCGKNKCKNRDIRRGKQRYKAYCQTCYARRRRESGNPQIFRTRRDRFLKNKCEICGFVPEHPIQLQLDHSDGNSVNNHPSNFQTMCANCHALKTWNNGDWITPSRQEAPYVWNGEQWIARTN